MDRRFAPQARRELIDAASWIAEDNPQAAIALVRAAVLAADMLAVTPSMGRTRPELVREPYRFWSLRGFPYLLVYDASERSVVRVVHQSRDLPTVLKDM